MKQKRRQFINAGILFVALSARLMAQPVGNKFEGSWQGTIKVPGGNLDIILYLKSGEKGLSAALDVPAQHAKGIAASLVRTNTDSLIVEFQMIMARYRGVYIKDSTLISGLWEQGSFSVPLRLRPAQPAVEVKHPQEPVKPYSYNEEEVSFHNSKDGVTLAGTFTWPKYRTACAAVVLITGSGAQNRNEELMGQKPFLVLADALTKKGIAVLRYDDRGAGKSTGKFSFATTADFSNDAEAALNYLKTRKEVNPAKLGLLGHSEGGMVAPMVAARSKAVAFIVLLAGPGIKGTDLLLLQSSALLKASGADEKEIAEKRKINQQIYRLVTTNPPGVTDSISEILEGLGMPHESAWMEAKKTTLPWVRYMLAFDPAMYLTKTTCPVLALNGKKDLQVPYEPDLKGIEEDLKKANNKAVTIKSYEDLNHLFQHCSSGLPEEYGRIEETMSPEVLKDVADWILAR